MARVRQCCPLEALRAAASSIPRTSAGTQVSPTWFMAQDPFTLKAGLGRHTKFWGENSRDKDVRALVLDPVVSGRV